MFWSKIREKLEEYGEVTELRNDYMVIPSHDNICGLGLLDQGKDISIISHMRSYGGREGLFEIMPSLADNNVVEGYLDEDEALEYIDKLMGKC